MMLVFGKDRAPHRQVARILESFDDLVALSRLPAMARAARRILSGLWRATRSVRAGCVDPGTRQRDRRLAGVSRRSGCLSTAVADVRPTARDEQRPTVRAVS